MMRAGRGWPSSSSPRDASSNEKNPLCAPSFACLSASQPETAEENYSPTNIPRGGFRGVSFIPARDAEKSWHQRTGSSILEQETVADILGIKSRVLVSRRSKVAAELVHQESNYRRLESIGV